MERRAQVRREGGDSPSRGVRYAIYLDGHLHSKHLSPSRALAVLSDIGVPQIKRVAVGRLLYTATIRPRLTSTGRLSPSWTQALAKVEAGSDRLYVHRHVLYQPKWHDHRLGDAVPTPSYNDLMNHAAKHNIGSPFHQSTTFQHQYVHNGHPVAKLEYSIKPLADIDTIHVNGLAVHPHHRGDGLASALMDKLQDNAAEHGRKIDHGRRTPDGYKWWQRYSGGKSFSPSVHAPSEGDHGPDNSLRSADTYDALFDPHEDRMARGAAASPSWVHYYDNVPSGWEV